jgi:uncharacterized protein GlcG (DUF336 family)
MLCLAVLLGFAIVPLTATAQEAEPVKCMNANAAHMAMKAGLAKAEELGCKISVAVFNCGADLKSFIRMDGAILGATCLAMEAGETAVTFGKAADEDGAAGVPVRTAEGKLIGAVGVAGCSPENNAACAEAAAAAVGGAAAAEGNAEAQIMEGLKLFKEGMENKDIEKLKTMISDDFSHYEFGDKDTLIAFTNMTMAQGDLDDAEIDLEYAETEVDGDTAVVYPVEMVAVFGSATIEFKLKKEADGVWRVIGMEMEGI